jgi:hypothetical protein
VGRKEVVIARYHEDVSWAEREPAVIYNKGPAIPTRTRQVFLPNVGREAHTYLFHITHAWNDLADTTLFTQGGLDHIPAGTRLDQFFDAVTDIVVPRVVRCREWGPDGRIVHYGIWQEKMARGQMAAGRLSLVAWFRTYLQLDLEALGGIIYAPGAVLSVRKECIRRRPLTYYQELLDAVSQHNDPEEAHYLERAWLYIFGSAGTKVRYLRA